MYNEIKTYFLKIRNGCSIQNTCMYIHRYNRTPHNILKHCKPTEKSITSRNIRNVNMSLNIYDKGA